MADDFDSNTTGLINWLEKSGASVSSSISLQDLRLRNAGRGVVAVKKILEDEVLFSIPRSLALSVQTSSFSHEYANLLDPFEADSWLQLILVMLYEYGKGSRSSWNAYFKVLPEEFDTLMYWSEEELSELSGGAVVNKIGKARADSLFNERLVPVVQENSNVFGIGSKVSADHIVQIAHRMGSLIMAYGFDIEPQAKEADDDGYATEDEFDDWQKGMVPLADLLNADGDEKNNAQLFYEQDALVMKAIKDISQGQEIYNTYGLLPRSDLLRRYGYVADSYAQYDVVEISHEDVVAVARDELGVPQSLITERTEFCETELDAVADGYDISRPPLNVNELCCIQPELRMIVLCYCLDATCFSEIPKPKKEILRTTDSCDFPIQWYHLMRLIVERRLNAYSTTLADDKRLRESLKDDVVFGAGSPNIGETRTQRRKILALEVRIGEKEILEQTLELLGKAESSFQNGSNKRSSDEMEIDKPVKRTK
ncbi:SET domain-containing protein [Tothia fuscella]|uniref:SET domain-containing protein n=1 Tax=Tothia fuscella TaxID=1048955 RepID=A0A9P4P1Q0_9PEZI|nr:SET domain-containing protein [Tothia fuscella]